MILISGLFVSDIGFAGCVNGCTAHSSCDSVTCVSDVCVHTPRSGSCTEPGCTGEGTCTNGQCVATGCTGPTSFCGDGTVDAGEQCDPSSDKGGSEWACCTSSCLFKPANTICNTADAADLCDVDDTCDAAGVCVPRVASPNTPCRGANGACDAPEVCDGVLKTCPADIGKPDGTPCGDTAALGVCDLGDTCDFATKTCKTNVKESGTLCRSKSDDCDVQEVCDGTNVGCPADEVAGTNVLCRSVAADDVCDLPDYCNAIDKACPADQVQQPGYECAPAVEGKLCDAADTCDGTTSNKKCNPQVQPINTLCRAKDGDCDVQEVCDGVSDSCPDDDVEPDTTVCRPVEGDCDIAENCDGETKDCGTDLVKDAGFVCGLKDNTKPCDKDDVCTGSTSDKACQVKYTDAGAVCLAAEVGNLCDVDDVCTGSSVECPASYATSAVVCRPSAGQCDVDDYCPGDGLVCDSDEKAGHVSCRSPVDDCDVEEFCDDIPNDNPNNCPVDNKGPLQICAEKFYDADTDGSWSNSATEPKLVWDFTVTGLGDQSGYSKTISSQGRFLLVQQRVGSSSRVDRHSSLAAAHPILSLSSLCWLLTLCPSVLWQSEIAWFVLKACASARTPSLKDSLLLPGSRRVAAPMSTGSPPHR